MSLLFFLKACQAKKTEILIEVFPDNLMLIKYSYQWLQGNTSHTMLSPKETFASIKFQIEDRSKYVLEVFSEIIQLQLHQPILMCPTITSLAWELWKADQFQTGLSSYVISSRCSIKGAFSNKIHGLKFFSLLAKGVFMGKNQLPGKTFCEDRYHGQYYWKEIRQQQTRWKYEHNKQKRKDEMRMEKL